ncbi:uncharacterized protein ACA1_068940 [Acanthamoeba castellanii str. Neff]|uniref:Uncharacterized protein n=1 Tax=Acanthamoeba castellanii (strain ATCC 30010 / Neff) TaxID=1257118 RepID=L8HDP0_ACACF|nr:uncharacterized protein ACA1_068940 [Acanthamoeba castellanii str. Neff]ELR23310.1 hypothetical protein ACA1_068940 [Acanthamoeba castellanii str. Neff]
MNTIQRAAVLGQRHFRFPAKAHIGSASLVVSVPLGFFIASQCTASRLHLKRRDAHEEPATRTSPQGTVHLHESFNGTVAVDYKLSNKETAIIM